MKKTILYICIILAMSAIIIFCAIFSNFITALSNKKLIYWNEVQLAESQKSYIKWVDFTPTAEVLKATSKLDINSHNSVLQKSNENQENNKNQKVITYNWIELIAYLSCKYGGNFKKFNQSDLNLLIEKLNNGSTMEELTKDYKYYSYYFNAYDAVLHEFIGEFELFTFDDLSGEYKYEKKYGIKAFSPIAKNYSFSHYDDFGASRSYGFKRVHLGNDLMGSIGTPIIAVESGIVEAIGWNQYGGWRIGIRSFDQKRYYYYAHLRKDHPYIKDLCEGQTVRAGDVIGYLGMTGYSSKENVNNINVPHLHFGMQLIFDESQKDGVNQIWIDVYQIVEFLQQNKSEVYKTENNDFTRKI